MTRFALDANVRVRAFSVGAPRREAAISMVESAARSQRCLLTLQTCGKSFSVATRKGHLQPAEAAAQIDLWLGISGPPAAATATALRQALAATVARRFSYWDALLLATAGEAGCEAPVSEDMGADAALAGCRVIPAFAPTGALSPEALAPLAG